MQVRVNDAPASKKGNALKILIMAFIAVSLPLWILFNKAESSELTRNISLALAELEEAESENLRLQTELDNLVTLARVEEFAQNELGMQKITSEQGKHITVDTGSLTDVAPTDDNPVAYISRRFNDFLEFFGLR